MELDMKIPNPVQKLDIERIIDDFVFICFVTGNDFIPHIPSLEIHEVNSFISGAVDLLIEVYKTSFNKMGGYIVDTDKVKDKHAAYLKVSRLEKFFHELSLYEEKIFLKRCQLREEENPDDQGIMVKSSHQTEGQDSTCRIDKSDIKLGSPGWKSGFFKEKYYPFYYAPFASDVKGLSKFKISFTLDKPLRPFDQLMAVLPPERHVSSSAMHYSPISFALSKSYSRLMDCEESVIQTYYLSELDIDTDGKRFLWQGIAKLPFIDVKLLLSVTKEAEKELGVHEMRRNTIRQDKIFLRSSNALGNNEAFAQTSDCSLQKLPIDRATCLPIENDQAISAKFFNPETVKPATRLLDNVILSEADISVKPLWHTYLYPGNNGNSMRKGKPITRSDAPCWRSSSSPPPPPPGRGRGGNATASVYWNNGGGRGSGVSYYGQTTRHQRTNGGVYWNNGGGRGGSYNLRPEGGGGGMYRRQQQQNTAWRPVGSPWGRGGGGDASSGAGAGGGGNGEHRAW
uniref:Xrn1 helical domain-containing protein n=1 Tax=Leersia perrieri TaxID=77586 RepID=A0A0D9XP87_9ORYZ